MATAELEEKSQIATIPEDVLQLRRFTVADYYRMAEVGILKSSDRVELLDGVISNMSPIGPGHASVVDRLAFILRPLVEPNLIIRVQNPVHLDEFSEPQPDLVLMKYRQDFYSRKHPTVDDIVFVVEVADTTLAKDLNVKLPLYAASGVREVWVVDIPGQKLLQFRNSDKKAYTDVKTLKSGDEIEIELSGIEKMRFAVNQILGIS